MHGAFKMHGSFSILIEKQKNSNKLNGSPGESGSCRSLCFAAGSNASAWVMFPIPVCWLKGRLPASCLAQPLNFQQVLKSSSQSALSEIILEQACFAIHLGWLESPASCGVVGLLAKSYLLSWSKWKEKLRPTYSSSTVTSLSSNKEYVKWGIQVIRNSSYPFKSPQPFPPLVAMLCRILHLFFPLRFPRHVSLLCFTLLSLPSPYHQIPSPLNNPAFLPVHLFLSTFIES